MSRTSPSGTGPGESAVYQIRIQGHLGTEWGDWFEGMAIESAGDGESTLTGPVADQAALHGLLKRVRDLGLPLLSVSRREPGRPSEADQSQYPSG